MEPGWRTELREIGAERQPVLVIDGFAPDPQRFIDDASFLAFEAVGPHYPGVRAPCPARLLDPLLDRLRQPIAEIFGVAAFDLADSFYSLVTRRASELTPIQRLPHFDGVEHGRLALLHYLARDERGGTAFYRHRATGFETVDSARLPHYRAALDRDLAREGLPAPGYIAGSTAIYEQLDRFAAVFNRAILYRSNTLHCAWIDDRMAFSDDPATGRLTVNSFLHAVDSA